MNNLSSYEEFSKGTGKPRQSLNFSIPISGNAPSSIKKNEDETGELSELPHSKEMKPARYTRAHQQMMNPRIDDEIQEDETFKICYDVIHSEYLYITKDLNRIEYSDPEMKKHVTELKKGFNDLLVKLQFFSEKGTKK
jgi:hypothetical protein